MGLEHVPHGDVLLEHGRESATGDLANLGAVGCEDLGPGSRGRAFANLEADASLGDGRGCLELRLDDVAADEIALLAAGLADGPGQAGFDGTNVLVEVVAVEAQARLQAEGIARAEAAHAGVGVLEELLREGDGVGLLERDLEAVLAGVPRAGQPHGLARDGRLGEHPKVQLAQVDVRQGLEHVDSLGTLEREQGAVTVDDKLAVLTLGLERLQVLVDVRLVLLAARAVEHDVHILVVHLGHHGVVDDAALVVGHHGEGTGAVLQAADVADDDGLDELDRVLTAHGRAEHVRDVEDGSLAPAVLGGLHDAVLVLDGHAVAREGDLDLGVGLRGWGRIGQ